MAHHCFFCDIQHVDDKSVFLSTDHFIARFDDFPLNKGHCEIVPKKHIVSFFELKEAEVVELFRLLGQAKDYLDKEYQPNAYNIGINEGEAAGRTIPHFHLHLIPRYIGDCEQSQRSTGIRNIIPEKADYITRAKEFASKALYLMDIDKDDEK